MTTPAGSRPRCADTARQRGDPPLGTAPMIRRWLLIEHPGPWPLEALTVADFPVELRATLSNAARAVVGRVLLIRRPGRAEPAHPDGRSWAVVTDRGTHWGRWHDPADLRAAAATLRHPEAGGGSDPILLVCAHGRHDTCCAVRGRPVAAELAQRWPEATWECTHVGGDRFAPNLIVLPGGVYYGYLEPADAVSVVARQLAGQVSATFLRGLTRYPPAAQVAVGTAHRRWGPFGLDDVVVHAVDQTAPDRFVVDLEVPDRGSVRLTIATAPRDPALLTCRATRLTSALDYTVVDG